MQTRDKRPGGPYYREPGFWLVMAPLIAVFFVVAALLTAAYSGRDHEVIDNYYKQGRLINQTFEQDARAKALGLKADVSFDAEAQRVQVTITRADGESLPGQLLLVMDHPVNENLDQHLVLRRVGAERYEASLDAELVHHWYLTLYPELDLAQRRSAPWRLRGAIAFSESYNTELAVRRTAD
ncbi:FixH family protein [Marinimicrobium alkaliphilum]|uniref:FixH family protein n=1 Tax=Marinimicrobium alkaliphilum TaxID=2202654 RepID=UPI000DBA563F|nr:FixH family protein [Marinimicrobium alkaliphilum]